MSALDFGTWRKMTEAPRDGPRVIVALRGTEQGPPEVDVARWAKPPHLPGSAAGHGKRRLRHLTSARGTIFAMRRSRFAP